MPRSSGQKKNTKQAEDQTILKGWKAIAEYLSIPPATAQRWARTGMPVKKEGRFTTAEIGELQRWLGRESHMPKPAYVATNQTDLAAALKDSISAMRSKKKR